MNALVGSLVDVYIAFVSPLFGFPSWLAVSDLFISYRDAFSIWLGSDERIVSKNVRPHEWTCANESYQN